ncbi:hypothetical protein D5R81_03030 [Parashewanella spongiae]|uniref:Type III secretion protein n=1 Tax=Parashewanella spongiae TaxID=342950 RepID=A0A3A6UIL7_9GAMM|nr:type III secretion system domain-containing protein [Parashewanella spongiae]MCL1076959.1 hypothetical protein [Parashewanella spongiae]RJY18925.1 hypothetical protein D5R81_03030 [Parashewanella spongiae]
MSSDFFSTESGEKSELRQYYEFVWHPAEQMHPSWWKKLGLQQWKSVFHRSPTLNERIETLIVKRMGIVDKPLPNKLSENDELLFSLKERLPSLVTILGIFCLNCPEYLSLKEYRIALADVLTDDQIQQAWALWPQRPTAEQSESLDTISADKLIINAQVIGLLLLTKEMEDDQIWRALAMTLPISVNDADEVNLDKYQNSITVINLKRWLLRLERLL